MKIFETGLSRLCSSSMCDPSRILWTYSARFGAPLFIRELIPAFRDRSGWVRTRRRELITGTHDGYKSERANAYPPRLWNGQLRAAANACFLEPEPAHSKARDRVSHHSRSARRIVIAKTDLRSVQLLRTRILWLTQLAA